MINIKELWELIQKGGLFLTAVIYCGWFYSVILIFVIIYYIFFYSSKKKGEQ